MASAADRSEVLTAKGRLEQTAEPLGRLATGLPITKEKIRQAGDLVEKAMELLLGVREGEGPHDLGALMLAAATVGHAAESAKQTIGGIVERGDAPAALIAAWPGAGMAASRVRDASESIGEVNSHLFSALVGLDAVRETLGRVDPDHANAVEAVASSSKSAQATIRGLDTYLMADSAEA